MKKERKEFGLLGIILIIIFTALITSITTGVILLNNSKASKNIKVSNDKDLQEFIEVYTSVLDDYYEDINKEEMIDKAIEAMLNYLGDDYTTYLNSSQTKELTDRLNGKYEGIGEKIKEGNIINKVFDTSPAKDAGLQVEDKIIKINDEDVTNLSTSDLATKIKSDNNKKVKITVKREEQEIELEITKKELYVPAIDSKIIENNGKKTGYIYISTFSDTVYNQFNAELKKIENENIDNLIIDVRNNTGGYLKAATDISSLFLEKGKVIYSLENKDIKDVYKDETKESRSYKVAVIINESTASASEILSAALKDSYNAVLVGKKSYGKGKVQQTANLKGGSMYKYTSAKWLTPSDVCIDKKGLSPDYEVDLQVSEDGSVVDTQLNKALEVLGE